MVYVAHGQISSTFPGRFPQLRVYCPGRPGIAFRPFRQGFPGALPCTCPALLGRCWRRLQPSLDTRRRFTACLSGDRPCFHTGTAANAHETRARTDRLHRRLICRRSSVHSSIGRTIKLNHFEAFPWHVFSGAKCPSVCAGFVTPRLLSKAEKRHRRAALQLEKWQKRVRQIELEHRRAVQGSLWEEDADVALQQNPGSIGTLFPA